MAFAYKEAALTADRQALPRFELAREFQAAPGRLRRSGRVTMLLSLVAVDCLAALAAFHLGVSAYLAVTGQGPAGLAVPHPVVVALSLPLCYWLMDVYRVHGQAPIERFPLRIKATCVLFVLLFGWYYAVHGLLWPLGAAAPMFVLAVVLPLVGERIVRTVLIRLGLWGVPTVVIGAGPIGRQVVRILQQAPELGLRPVGFFDDRHASDEGWQTGIQDLPVLGSIADSAKYSDRIETAIITTPTKTQETADAVAMQLGYRDIIVVPDLGQLPTLWVRTRDLNGLIGLQMRRNLLLRRNRLLKQTTDHLIALPLALLSAPIIAVLALWIMAVSGGSPFYAQLRAGKDGRPIRVWKLRTMYADAEARLEQHLAEHPDARQEWNRYFKLSNDPRILPGIGHVLRRTSLDELPQIVNVIRGEMSLVGPRPFPKYHLDQFDPSFQSLRSSVVPGITGLWQVSARSDGDLEVQQALDTYYIRNWSIWIDFYILSRTLGAVLAGRGAR